MKKRIILSFAAALFIAGTVLGGLVIPTMQPIGPASANRVVNNGNAHVIGSGLVNFSTMERASFGHTSNPVGANYSLRNRGPQNQTQVTGAAPAPISWTNFQSAQRGNQSTYYTRHASLQEHIAITGELAEMLAIPGIVENMWFEFFFGMGVLAQSHITVGTSFGGTMSFIDLNYEQIQPNRIHRTRTFTATGQRAWHYRSTYMYNSAAAGGSGGNTGVNLPTSYPGTIMGPGTIASGPRGQVAANATDSRRSFGVTDGLQTSSGQNMSNIWRFQQGAMVVNPSSFATIAQNGGLWLRMFGLTSTWHNNSWTEVGLVLEGVRINLDINEANLAELPYARSASDEVIAKINALPNVEDVTVADTYEIEIAREAFNALSTFATTLVPTNIVSRLVSIESALNARMQADIVIALIEQLPDAEDVTFDDVDAIQNARVYLDGLTTDARNLVSETLVARLIAAEGVVSSNQDAANVAIGLISALPVGGYITVTDIELIDQARYVLDALNPFAMEFVPTGIINTLIAAENFVYTAQSQATHVYNLINNLPDAQDIVFANLAAITNARLELDALHGLARDLVPVVVVDRLVAAENAVVLANGAALAVVNAVNALPQPQYITIADVENVLGARILLDGLSVFELSFVSIDVIATLMSVEYVVEIAYNLADEVIVKINSLPDASEITLNDVPAIFAARVALDKLTGLALEFIPSETITRLEQIEGSIEGLRTEYTGGTRAVVNGWTIGAQTAEPTITNASANIGQLIGFEFRIGLDGEWTPWVQLPSDLAVGSYYVRALFAQNLFHYAFATAPTQFVISQIVRTGITVEIADWTIGEQPSTPKVIGLPEDFDGDYEVQFYVEGEWITKMPTTLGTHLARVIVFGTQNVAEFISETVEFAVLQIQLSGITVEIDDWTVDEEPATPRVLGLPEGFDGEYQIQFYVNGVWVTARPTTAGTHQARVVVFGTTNVAEFVSAVTSFEIEECVEVGGGPGDNTGGGPGDVWAGGDGPSGDLPGGDNTVAIAVGTTVGVAGAAAVGYCAFAYLPRRRRKI